MKYVNSSMTKPTSLLKTLNILFLASEAAPFIKVGGLGDVAGSLPYALHAIPSSELKGYSLDIRLVIPFHRQIAKNNYALEKIAGFPIYRGKEAQIAEIFRIKHAGLQVFLISGDPITNSPEVYSQSTEKDGEKYVYFSLASLELCKVLDWKPAIIHANDWHTAIAISKINELRKTEPFFNCSHSIITLHNLPFMGAGTEVALDAYQISPSNDPTLPDWSRHIPLPMGLSSADRIVTVSHSYASEIMTPEYGCGLENFLATRSSIITGILNGLDEEIWNPATDKHLVKKFNITNISDRRKNKLALIQEMGFVKNIDLPLIAIISRMDRQKGISIALDTLRRIADLPWRAVILGSGDPNLESAAIQLEKDMPKKVCVVTKFDSALSHRLYGGADILFMPSLYEPCGLSQMIGMHYGCLPVARAVGGLKDTIKHRRTGFLFSQSTPIAAGKTLSLVLQLYEDKNIWQNMQIQAMSKDFSWKNSAKKYASLYLELEEENAF